MRSLWTKIGLTSDQNSYRTLQDRDDKKIPIATGVRTTTAYNASKKFKGNLKEIWLDNFASIYFQIHGDFVSWFLDDSARSD